MLKTKITFDPGPSKTGRGDFGEDCFYRTLYKFCQCQNGNATGIQNLRVQKKSVMLSCTKMFMKKVSIGASANDSKPNTDSKAEECGLQRLSSHITFGHN